MRRDLWHFSQQSAVTTIPAHNGQPNGIVVWQYCVADADERTVQVATTQLDAAERERMMRFVRYADRRRFALAHEQPQWAGASACQLVSPPGYAAAVAWLSNH